MPAARDGLGTRVKLVLNSEGGVDRQVWRNYGAGYAISHQRTISDDADAFARANPKAVIEGRGKTPTLSPGTLQDLVATATDAQLASMGLKREDVAPVFRRIMRDEPGPANPPKDQPVAPKPPPPPADRFESTGGESPAEVLERSRRENRPVSEGEQALPESFPHRDLLAELGVFSVEQLDEFTEEESLSRVKGFGPARAAAIKTAREALGDAETDEDEK